MSFPVRVDLTEEGDDRGKHIEGPKNQRRIPNQRNSNSLGHHARDQNMQPTRRIEVALGSYKSPNVFKPNDYLDDDEVDEFLKVGAFDSVDATQKSSSKSLQPHRPQTQILEKYKYDSLNLYPNCGVELRDGTFVRIVEIIKRPITSKVTIRGYRFQRTKTLHGQLELQINEICWLIDAKKGDVGSPKEQLTEVPVEEVVRRRKIVLTNQLFPKLSFRDDIVMGGRKEVLSKSVLVCRWKFIQTWPDIPPRSRVIPKAVEFAMLRIREGEADRNCSISDDTLRQNFRGPTAKGGSHSGFSQAELSHIQKERMIAFGVEGGVPPRKGTGDKIHEARYGTCPIPTPPEPENPDTGADALSPIDVDMLFKCPKKPKPLAPKFTFSVPSGTYARSAQALRVEDNNRNRNLMNEPLLFRKMAFPSRTPTIDLTGEGTVTEGVRNLALTGGQICGNTRTIKKLRQNVPSPPTNGNADFHLKAIEEARFQNSSNPLKRQRVDSPRKTPHSPTLLLSRSLRKPIRLESDDSDSDATIIGDADNDTNWDVTHKEFKVQDRPEPDEFLQRSKELEAEKNSHPVKANLYKEARRYTFGDGFSGCGGTSRGANMAGFRIEWAFDKEAKMCESYLQSFPTVTIGCCEAFDFATLCRYGYRVDIMHLSPPCQFFSPAHTVFGQDDETNIASSFCITAILKKILPRIVTLENTSGLLERHPEYLHPVIQQFTALGFSVRWKILNLANYGVPQRRRRLVIMASCPGEALPDFPEPTHSEKPHETGLKPWVTIRDCLDQIPEHWPNHNPHLRRACNKPPYSRDMVAKTITTTGGIGNYHPSGKRGFTSRELATLMTFPLEHMFANGASMTLLNKQIGNAVPPLFAKTLFEHIKKHLMKVDGVAELDM